MSFEVKIVISAILGLILLSIIVHFINNMRMKKIIQLYFVLTEARLSYYEYVSKECGEDRAIKEFCNIDSLDLSQAKKITNIFCWDETCLINKRDLNKIRPFKKQRKDISRDRLDQAVILFSKIRLKLEEDIDKEEKDISKDEK